MVVETPLVSTHGAVGIREWHQDVSLFAHRNESTTNRWFAT